jgi:peptidoglycan/xylan/chitin deacetylase (PgdA/CDA1 family)
MSRPPTPFIGLLLAVLLLVFGNAVNREDSVSIVVAGTAPTAGASAQQAAASPRQPAASASGKPRSRPRQPTKPQTRQRSQFRPSDKPAADRSGKSQSRPSTNQQASKHGGTVYLTFDDGPSPYTPAILKILRSTGSTATFFELGSRQAQYPSTAAHIRAEGSNIGNHTYNHPDLTALTAGQIRWQVTHGPRGRCMRPPYGATNPRVRHVIAEQGLREVLWSIDTLDWSRPGTTKIIKAATGPAVRAGSIVLLHDGGGDRSQTVAALPKIVRTLRQRGYMIRRLPGC